MKQWINTKTGVTVYVDSELAGDWEPVEETGSQEEKPKAKKGKKKWSILRQSMM